MTASFFSAVGVMGYPSQIYTTGVTFSLTAFNFFLPVILNAEIIGPLFRKLQLVSVNEYLELRFTRGVRYMGCFFFHMQFMLYLSIVLYAPSLALYSVADVPLAATIISTGCICTLYTSLGGMRAVIWTDVFQSFVMIVGLLGATVIAVLRVGSIATVVDTAWSMQRLNIDFSMDPKVFQSFWGVMIGLPFGLLSSWCIAQPTVQRVLAARTDRDAKKALYASCAALVFIVILLSVVGLVVFTFYADCDPKCSGRISKTDQILPYFIVNELGWKGVPGLLTACIFSFALSTISSALNGSSALFLEDVAKKLKPDMTEELALRVSKIVAVIGGVFVTGFAFVINKLGQHVMKLTINLFGIVGGPYFSIFALGIFTEKTNAIGAYVGGFSGFSIGMFLLVGQLFYPPDLNLPPVSVRGCSALNITVTQDACFTPPSGNNEPIALMFSISYCWHGFISVLLACAIGYTTSVLFPDEEVPIRRALLYNYNENFIVKRWCGRNSASPVVNGRIEVGAKEGGVARLKTGRGVAALRTSKWCGRHRIPSKIDEQPEEDAVLITMEEKL